MIQINRQELVESLNLVKQAASSTTRELPIFRSVIFEYKSANDVLTLKCSNSYIYAEVTGVGVIGVGDLSDTDDFSFAVDVNMLYNYCSMCDVEIISIERKGKTVLVKGNGEFTLALFDEGCFPRVPEIDRFANVDFEVFMSALDRVKVCVSNDVTRQYLMGICLDKDRFIAADGYRASVELFNTDVGIRAVFRADMVSLLSMADRSGILRIGLSSDGSWLCFSKGNVKLFSRLFTIDKFPVEEINKVCSSIIVDNQNFVVIPTVGLMKALERVGIVVGQSGMCFVDIFNDGVVKLRAVSSVGDTVVEELVGKTNMKDSVSLKFDYKHLLEICGAVMNKDIIELRFGSKSLPLGIDMNNNGMFWVVYKAI